MISVLPIRKAEEPRDLAKGMGPGSTILLVACGRSATGLQSGFENKGFRAVNTGHVGLALEMASSLRPALILVGDHPADGRSAEEAVSALRGILPFTTILFLSDGVDWERASALLDAGTHDVISPPHALSAILLRARIVSEREGPIAMDAACGVLRFGAMEVNLNSRHLTNGNEEVQLTGREFELLNTLFEARGGVVKRETLVDEIWGLDQGSESVLDATVHRLRRKLEQDPSNPRHLTTVRGVGYRLELREPARASGF